MDGIEESAAPQAVVEPKKVSAEKPEVSDERKALVELWIKRVKESKDHHAPVFKRMDTCMKIAAHGSADDDWIKNDKYVMPVINRHINLSVAQLYAKHPTVIAKRKEKLLYKIWDGKQDSLAAAMEAMSMGDVSQLPLLEDILQAQQYMTMLDKTAKTMGLLWTYFMGEQEYDYKAQLKAAVRRTKVCCVSYVKLGYQRIMEPNPEKSGSIADLTSKIQLIERLLEEGKEPDYPEGSPNIEELRLNLADLQQEAELVVREGPILSFPKAKAIIIDKKCAHLKTFVGARWVAEEFDMDCEDIEETYGKDVKAAYTSYEEKSNKEKGSKAKVWEIWDRKARQVLTVCDGYPDFIREPMTPDVKIERFFTIFPIVFNEIESEKDLYPSSDVWLARHPQDEINRARQGVREHRVANRPWYASMKGALSEEDRARVSNHGAHEVIEFSGMGPDDDIKKKIQKPEMTAIDEGQYGTSEHFDDILRTVGTQEANFGPTSGATATESSIAENSRQSGQSDNVDDLDDVLTNLARAGGQLMLTELSKDIVLEIAGPGAVWPDHAITRTEMAKDLQLDIEAGSSGRPNRAAELADMERAAPTILQVPDFNSKPLLKKYLNLLNIDLEEAIVEGMPSVTALNSIMAKPAQQPGTGDPATDPAAQGGKGAQNAPVPAGGQNQGQPAFPAPAAGVTPATNQI